MYLTSGKIFSKTSLADVVNLKTEHKCGLINAFWPHLHLAEQDYIEEDYAAFFEFIGRTLQGLHPHAPKFASQELDGLLAMVCTLRTNRTLGRKAIIETIKKDYLNTCEFAVARSIELTVRLWLGINVSAKRLSVGPRNPRDSRIDWQDHHSLDQMVSAQFPYGANKTALTEFPLDESFTAVNLKNVCRLHIRWTDNLMDHLRLEGPRGQRSLSIYRHKICLINHRKGPEPKIIQEEILDEAIRTLDLLFPFGDPKTEEFLENEKVQLCIVDLLELPRATDLDEFKYWRNNLAQLVNLLNGPPETVVQTLLDTRNLGQFVTLWVAIFGIFLLTILFGILSTIYSVKQYRLAIKSYELALALACQQKTAPLPNFCD
jgi:hypothetical protein